MRPTHPELLAESVTRYIRHLDRIERQLSPGGRFAAEALADSLRNATEHRERLRPEQVRCTWRQLAAAEVEDAELFINQWQLGWGSDAAPVVLIGTEHAYELLPAVSKGGQRSNVGLAELTFECLCGLIWLCQSSPEVMSAIASAPWWSLRKPFDPDQPYHIYTAEYHRAAPRATWPTIGRDLLRGASGWRTVLGERCYQIELSGYPSLVASRGREPYPERLSFLRTTLTLFAQTAKVLVFHGSPKSSLDPREELAAIFLGRPRLGHPDHTGNEGGQQWQCFDEHDRRVIFSRALSGSNVSGRYLSRLSVLISEISPEAVASVNA